MSPTVVCGSLPKRHLRTLVRSFVGVVVTIFGVMTAATVAWAHIDPDPREAQAGSELSVGFTVQHGCEGSPTVRLAMRLPAGVGGAVAEPPEGWSGAVDGNVVSFEDGVLPDDVELTFRVRMVLPATPDVTVYFPFVQYCDVGEIRWIDVPSDGSNSELDEPAPAMSLVGPVASPPASTVLPTTVAATPSTTVVTIVPSSIASTSMVATSTSSASPTIVATSRPSSTIGVDVAESSPAAPVDGENVGPGNSGAWVFGGILVVLAAMAGLVARSSRRALAARG